MRSPSEEAWTGQWAELEGFDFGLVISHMGDVRKDEKGEEESSPGGVYVPSFVGGDQSQSNQLECETAGGGWGRESRK